MCLIALAWTPDAPQRLLLAANRDEYHARRAQPLNVWPAQPGLIAGQDVESGGSWLGFTRDGRFAALTNFRDPARHEARARSRGDLVAGFLRSGHDAATYARQVAAIAALHNGFNLLLGDRHQLWWVGHRRGEAPDIAPLAPGLHAVSNHRPGTPWPKLVRAHDNLAGIMQAHPPGAQRQQALLHMLLDRQPAPDEALPDTGVGLHRERQLSSIFVLGNDYGTRCSTVASIGCGRLHVEEHRFAPDGRMTGRTRVDLPLSEP
jgi:uncharacterized protein with NRDE domain